jgi:cob(I)alamin adenosyltransferase
MQDGKLQIYTGDGKGKTTASLGLALRAAGAGLKVAFIQFDKGHREGNEHYSERRVVRTIPGIDLLPTGLERMNGDGSFRFGVTPADRAEAERGLALAESAVTGEGYDLVVLDDVIGGLSYGLVDRERLDRIVRLWSERRSCELVLTGRDTPPELVALADLVTEMKKVKHYYDAGAPARKGFEW